MSEGMKKLVGNMGQIEAMNVGILTALRAKRIPGL